LGSVELFSSIDFREKIDTIHGSKNRQLRVVELGSSIDVIDCRSKRTRQKAG